MFLSRQCQIPWGQQLHTCQMLKFHVKGQPGSDLCIIIQIFRWRRTHTTTLHTSHRDMNNINAVHFFLRCRQLYNQTPFIYKSYKLSTIKRACESVDLSKVSVFQVFKLVQQVSSVCQISDQGLSMYYVRAILLSFQPCQHICICPVI